MNDSNDANSASADLAKVSDSSVSDTSIADVSGTEAVESGETLSSEDPRQTRLDSEEGIAASKAIGASGACSDENDGADLETIRIAPASKDFRPIKIVRMLLDRGATWPRLTPKEADPLVLAYPDGIFGEWERSLAQGAVATVRDAIDVESLGTLPEVDDEQAKRRDILARVCIMDGEVEKARVLIEGIRGDDRVCTSDACLAVGDGDVPLAQKRARTALDRDPEGVVAHYVNALVCVAEGDYQRGFEELAAVSRASQEHAVARHQLGQLTYATGDPARAGTLFEQATEIAPTFLPPALTMAEMLIESHQYGDALAILNRAAEAAPDALAPRLLELRILLEVGDDESAVTLADVLHRAAPHHPEVSRMWADAMMRAGREDEAKEALEALLPTAIGAPKAQALRLLAKIDQTRGNAEQARARLFEAVAAAPSDGELVLELAQTLFRTGASEEASETLLAFAKRPDADVSNLLSGAMMARENGDDDLLASLATASLQRVNGTPSEPQVHAVLQSIGVDIPNI